MSDFGSKSETVSVKNWIATFILLAIPGLNILAGIGYLLVGKRSKKNFIIAIIVSWILAAVLAAIAGAILYFCFKDTWTTIYDAAITDYENILDRVKDLLNI